MKLYVDRGGTAPSPRRVRIYLAEKGLEIPTVEMELHVENRSEAFRAKNPVGTLPVLELDDGTCIAESVSICRYLEALHPDPPLFGTDPLDAALVDMWMRRVELYLYLMIDMSHPEFLDEAAGEKLRGFAYRAMALLDRELATRAFIAGERYSMADVFALSALDFGIAHVGYEIPAKREHLLRWHRTCRARPSGRV